MRDPRWFRYTALDAAKPNAIRLVSINPGLPHDLISCHIEHTDIQTNKYSALSYEWGAKDDNQHILVDGLYFEVRRNLWDFLYQARPTFGSRPLWIDAISINQEDEQEKSGQVQKMGEIYHNAEEVLIWLGPHRACTSHAWKYVEAYHSLQRYRSVNDLAAVLKHFMDDDDLWQGLQEIYDSEYWKRAWIAQEYLLAKERLILQGDEMIPYSAYTSFFGEFLDLTNPSIRLRLTLDATAKHRYLEISHWQSSRAHALLHQQRTRGGERSYKVMHAYELADLLTAYDTPLCQDVRDRIYAVLSLARGGNRFVVDYTIQPFELFLESLWFEKAESEEGSVATAVEHSSTSKPLRSLRKAGTAREYLTVALATSLEVTPVEIVDYSKMRRSATSANVQRDAKRGKLVNKVHVGTTKTRAGNYIDQWSATSTGAYDQSLTAFPEPIDMRLSLCYGISAQDLIIGINKFTGVRGRLGYSRCGAALHESSQIIKERDTQFLMQERPWCQAAGIYETSRIPEEWKVYYLLGTPAHDPALYRDVGPTDLEENYELTSVARQSRHAKMKAREAGSRQGSVRQIHSPEAVQARADGTYSLPWQP